MSEISNVLVVDRQLLCRSGLASILRANFKSCRVSAFGDIGEALGALAQSEAPTLLAVDGGIDLAAPGIGGVRALRLRHPRLVLAIIDWRHDRQAALEALEAGAHGYIPKDMEQADLVRAFKLVLAGQVYVPTMVSDVDAGERGTDRAAPQRAPLPDLTGRQREVLEHMSLGKSNKEIARALRISESTVKVHVAAAFRLLGVHNRVGAVAKLQSRSAGAMPLVRERIPGAVFARRTEDRITAANGARA